MVESTKFSDRVGCKFARVTTRKGTGAARSQPRAPVAVQDGRHTHKHRYPQTKHTQKSLLARHSIGNQSHQTPGSHYYCCRSAQSQVSFTILSSILIHKVVPS